MDPTTILIAARSALEGAALATSSLVQSLPDSATAIPDSSWTVREAAVHLVNDARMYRELATGTSSPIPTLVKEQHEVFVDAARTVVWTTMLEAAGLALVEGSVSELAEAVLNGRQIRNLTRLAKILHPGGTVTLTQMRNVLRYGCA